MPLPVEGLFEEDVPAATLPVRPSITKCRALAVGDYLYQEGDARTCAYRVEKGAVAVFERLIDRPAHIIEMAGEGDYLGLGSLEQHRDNARAVVHSNVSPVPNTDLALLAEHNAKLRQKQAEAFERDFEHSKMLATDRSQSAPVERVAAFLIAVSRQNTHEGRDPAIVSDSLKCGVVASLLDLDIQTLACPSEVAGDGCRRAVSRRRIAYQGHGCARTHSGWRGRTRVRARFLSCDTALLARLWHPGARLGQWLASLAAATLLARALATAQR